MELLSISEAAKELRVNPSRVRSLVSSGELPGVKIGGRWLLDRGDIARRARSPRPAGRPFEAANAWGALFLASGLDAPWLDPQAHGRIRQALLANGLAGLKPRLVKRSKSHRFFAHTGELGYLRKRRGAVRSGISAAGAYELDLAPGSEIDVYVPASEFAEIQREHALEPALPGEGNAVLRVVPDPSWHLSDLGVAPMAAVAIDLSEDPDSRSARIGNAEIRRIDRGLRSRI